MQKKPTKKMRVKAYESSTSTWYRAVVRSGDKRQCGGEDLVLVAADRSAYPWKAKANDKAFFQPWAARWRTSPSGSPTSGACAAPGP